MDASIRTLALSVAGYTVATVLVGLWRSRTTREEGEDFYLASRGLGAWLVALSGAASGESGWVLLGLVGAAYSGGIGALWVVPGMLAGYAFNWFVLAPRLRAASVETGALTIPSVLAARHPESAGAIRAAGTTILLLFVTAYVAAQFTAVGKALEAMFGLPYAAGVFAGLAVVFAYVISGGFRASVWTDVVQALFMVVALVAMPAIEFARLGAAGLDELHAVDGLLDPLGGTSGFALFGFLAGWLGIGLGNPGQPHVLVRFMAARDDRELRRGGAIACAWTLLVYLGAIATGMVARLLHPALADPERALPVVAMELLPPVLAGFVLAAVLAAICSTADSQLLVVSSSVSLDAFPERRRFSLRNRETVALVGLAAAALAATEARVVFGFVLYAWSALGAGFGPALAASLFRPGTSGRAVLASMGTGVAVTVVWKNVPALSAACYELVPAFFAALAVAWGWPRGGAQAVVGPATD